MALFMQPIALPPADILTLSYTTWCSRNSDWPPHYHSTYCKVKILCVSTPHLEAKNAASTTPNSLCTWQLCSPSPHHPTPGCVYAHCPPCITEVVLGRAHGPSTFRLTWQWALLQRSEFPARELWHTQVWSDRTPPRGIWAWLSVRTGSGGLRLPIFSELEQRADTPSGDEVLCLFRVISGSAPTSRFPHYSMGYCLPKYNRACELVPGIGHGRLAYFYQLRISPNGYRQRPHDSQSAYK